MKRNFTGSLDTINQTIVTFQHFIPALIEKMRVQMVLQDWDQVLDTVNRLIYNKNPILGAVIAQVYFLHILNAVLKDFKNFLIMHNLL